MTVHIEEKSWFRKNWMWAVPVGGCLTVILLFVLGIGATIFGVTKLFPEPAPYKYALEQASHNSMVIQHLGQNIESNGMMQGNISYHNDDGGTKGKGSVTIIGKKTAGVWEYETLFATIHKTKEQINLLDQSLEGI